MGRSRHCQSPTAPWCPARSFSALLHCCSTPGQTRGPLAPRRHVSATLNRNQASNFVFWCSMEFPLNKFAGNSRPASRRGWGGGKRTKFGGGRPLRTENHLVSSAACAGAQRQTRSKHCAHGRELSSRGVLGLSA